MYLPRSLDRYVYGHALGTAAGTPSVDVRRNEHSDQGVPDFGSWASSVVSRDGACCQSWRCARASSATRRRLMATDAAPRPGTTQTIVQFSVAGTAVQPGAWLTRNMTKQRTMRWNLAGHAAAQPEMAHAATEPGTPS